MSLHFIAARIRSRGWDESWFEEFAGYIPEELWHLFACDCASRALELEKKRGREAHKRVWELVLVKRKWLRGEANSRELEAAFESAHAAVGYAPLRTEKASPLAVAVDAALEAAAEDPLDAAIGAAWSAARASAVAKRDGYAEDERGWQAEHLAKLCEHWGNNGDGALQMIEDYYR